MNKMKAPRPGQEKLGSCFFRISNITTTRSARPLQALVAQPQTDGHYRVISGGECRGIHQVSIGVPAGMAQQGITTTSPSQMLQRPSKVNITISAAHKGRAQVWPG